MRTVGVAALLAAIWTCSAPQPANTSVPSNAPSVEDMAAVVEVLVEQLGVSANQVKPDATLLTLGADELDAIEVILAIEERFRVEITDEQIARQVGGTGLENRLTARGLAALVAQNRSK